MAVAYHDYYETLGVPRDASDEEIRRTYRRLARRYHPDVNKEPGAEDRFKEISEAYEVLGDREKRERYDRLGANWRSGEDVSGAAGFGGFGGGPGAGGAGGPDIRFDFGGGGGVGGDFSDFFDQLFRARGGGGMGGGRSRAGRGGFDGFATRGGDHEAELELTLEEAAAGGRRHLSFGDGREYDVEIPPGVRDGQRIRLSGQGGAGAGGGPPGDLFLRVRLRPHPRFRVDGRDLSVELPVAPWEAALGATVPVPTLTGTVRVKVPAGSSCGRRLRLRGAGMPGPRGGHGDLHAVVKIAVPKQLGERERELFEQLRDTSAFDPRRGA
ncbi:MAG TPA: DnaJ C-terminal domain-containing protein [Conexibacter sp.]|jgi:curved DNA-binding protein|nr:DnaJ C-terminal domain-containing protein [Conexibacter sp.]